MGNFELLHSSLISDKIPVSEYVSRKSGITVVIAEMNGPIVNGFFCVATETFDDDGIPHILEHILFTGSKQYPYKRALNLLVKRCLGSEAYAASEVDHICYMMETAGSEGFLTLMPIFLDYIFHPLLSEESFVTEVHHITGEGKDAGLVYCEMEDYGYGYPRVDSIVAKNIYPGRCGYSSEICGKPENLRESVNMTKVRKFHKEFHIPKNLKIIITGQIKPDEVIKTLENIEEQLISEEERGSFQRPWQNPIPPLKESKDVYVEYRADEASTRVFCMSWRIGSCVTNSYDILALKSLLYYLTHSPTSLLEKELVNTEDYSPIGVTYHIIENADSCASITFHDVPENKISDIKIDLQIILKKMLRNAQIDINFIKNNLKMTLIDIISSLDYFVSHVTISTMITPLVIYGSTNEEFQSNLNPQTNINKLLKEPESFWLNLLQKYFIDNKYVAVHFIPSLREQEMWVKKEEERIEAQIQRLKVSGLKEKADILEKAIKFHEREPPIDLITSIPIPSFDSIKLYNISRYKTESSQKQPINLLETPIFTYFDNLETNFVYIFALLDTSSVPAELRIYLPLLLTSLLKLPVERDGKIIPYKEISAQRNYDTESNSISLGLEDGELYWLKCGSCSQTCVINLEVETSKYKTGFKLLKELLYKTVFTIERLKNVALQMTYIEEDIKTNGSHMVSYAMNGLCFLEDSNIIKIGLLQQKKFLADIIEKLDSDASKDVLANMEKLRKIITKPSNVVLYIAGDLNYIENPLEPITEFVPSELIEFACQQKLNSTPDYTFLKPGNSSLNGCIIEIDGLESPCFCQTTKILTSYADPDLPAVMLYLQYITESPEWKQMRAKVYFHQGKVNIEVNKGLLCLQFWDFKNVIDAYKGTKQIIDRLLTTKAWNNFFIDTAKNSLVFELIDNIRSITSLMHASILSYFNKMDINFRTFLGLINKVTIEDLNRVGEKYIAALFDPLKVKTAIVVKPSEVANIAKEFKKLGLTLTVYPSLEESFLNTL